MSDNLGRLIEQAQSGDSLAFSRLLTQIETQGPAIFQCEELLQPKQLALRVGITGPPGAGKSTLMHELLQKFLQSKKRIGVIAVDPTSPHSQGAILGDRIRYGEVALDPRVFLRSLGTRGSLGGLSSAVYLMLRAFDACGFDLVLIETVGVGQVEVEIMNVADLVTLVLVPESGDSIQAMKAGIIEIADLVVVNKADRPGADAIRREIENELGENGDGAVAVLKSIATSGEGASEIAHKILELASHMKIDHATPAHLRAEAFALGRAHLEEALRQKYQHVETPADLKKVTGSFSY